MTEIDTSRPHPARMYDYYLGGKTNYAADREAAEEVIRMLPGSRVVARTQRDLMGRVTHFLSSLGVRQYLDIGTGIPTEPNLHQVAQRLDPTTEVVYVDNDPIVLTYAQTLLQSSPRGRTQFILADVREPDTIFGAPETQSLDFSQPVALCLLGILHFLPDEVDTAALVRRLMEPLPPGSYLTVSVLTHDFAPERWQEVGEVYRSRGVPLRTYTKADVVSFFDGLDLVDPGIVVSNQWRPEIAPSVTSDEPARYVSMYGGVARKP